MTQPSSVFWLRRHKNSSRKSNVKWESMWNRMWKEATCRKPCERRPFATRPILWLSAGDTSRRLLGACGRTHTDHSRVALPRAERLKWNCDKEVLLCQLVTYVSAMWCALAKI